MHCGLPRDSTSKGRSSPMNDHVRTPAVELVYVSKTKPVLLGDSVTRLQVIQDVSFSMPKGEILALMGPSGSGKSTLLRMINRLEDPTAGQINLFGTDISSLDVRELRRRVGMVFQTPALIAGTVADNVSYGPRLRQEDCDPGEYLDLVQLERDLLNRPATALSVGQQQRMCIARALANHPEVLLLDEPTSALDQTAANTVLDLVCRLNRELGLTVIMVTHLMEHARAVGTQAVLLVRGAKIEEGPADAFFASPATEIGRRFLQGELSNER